MSIIFLRLSQETVFKTRNKIQQKIILFLIFFNFFWASSKSEEGNQNKDDQRKKRERKKRRTVFVASKVGIGNEISEICVASLANNKIVNLLIKIGDEIEIAERRIQDSVVVLPISDNIIWSNPYEFSRDILIANVGLSKVEAEISRSGKIKGSIWNVVSGKS